MTLTELDRESGNGAVTVPDELTSTAKARRRRWPWVVAVAVVVLTALVVMAVLAGTYQPLLFGGESGGSFPGLPFASGGRSVNTFGAETGEFYVPTQRTAFAILESIENSGPRAVTIEAVSLVPPNQMPPSHVNPWPLQAAGPVLYMPEYYTGHEKRWTAGRPVQGLALGANQSIVVGIPVRMADACYAPNSSTGTDVFYVQERFLTFTHWVALPLGTPLIMREPEPRRNGSGLICLK
jgi:hypothetical protein